MKMLENNKTEIHLNVICTDSIQSSGREQENVLCMYVFFSSSKWWSFSCPEWNMIHREYLPWWYTIHCTLWDHRIGFLLCTTTKTTVCTFCVSASIQPYPFWKYYGMQNKSSNRTKELNEQNKKKQYSFCW